MFLDCDQTRLAVARQAASLFIERGVAGTSGDDIAAASALSKRTAWRYFRTKESCIEPLFIDSALRFAKALQLSPLEQLIDDFQRSAMRVDQRTPQTIADYILAVPFVWLYACHLLKQKMHAVVSRRANRSVLDFDVRLCAATIVAAIRVVDESVSNEIGRAHV